MDTEAKKIEVEDKVDDPSIQDGSQDEINNIDDKGLGEEGREVCEDVKQEDGGTTKDSTEDLEAQSDVSEAAEKDEKEEVEAELTKEEIEEIIKKSLERDDFLDKLQRIKAEYLNFQKRKNKEIGDIRRFAIQDLVISLTSVLDNFTRAIQFTKESKDFDKLLEGIQLVEDQFYKTLEDFGVKRIETIGKPFDPGMHEAVIEEADDSHPHHTVTMELQTGFLLHDRVIRPAKVKVSKKVEKEGGKDNKQADAEEKEEVKDTEE